jgi:prolyl-tRNA editing enzyme YbaK/EbsC (Cys-tRNA(Pro) deacylase)
LSTKLSASAKRVQDFLAEKGFSFEVKELSESMRTAQETADSVGCAVGQIAKSLVFKDKKTAEPVLAIASGASRVDLAE